MPVGATLAIVTHTTKHGKIVTYRYWKARIFVDGRNMALGNYRTKADAVNAYQRARKLYKQPYRTT